MLQRKASLDTNVSYVIEFIHGDVLLVSVVLLSIYARLQSFLFFNESEDFKCMQ